MEDGLPELAWSEAGLAELTRVLVGNKDLAARHVEVFTRQIRRTAPNGCVQPEHYEHLTGSMTGPDLDDYLHSGAARAAGADALVSSLSVCGRRVRLTMPVGGGRSVL